MAWERTGKTVRSEHRRGIAGTVLTKRILYTGQRFGAIQGHNHKEFLSLLAFKAQRVAMLTGIQSTIESE